MMKDLSRILTRVISLCGCLLGLGVVVFNITDTQKLVEGITLVVLSECLSVLADIRDQGK